MTHGRKPTKLSAKLRTMHTTPPLTGALKRRHRDLPVLELLTMENLDHRSKSALLFNKLVRGIRTDLGEDLTTIEEALVNSFAAATLLMTDTTARILTGTEVDLVSLAQIARVQYALASKLGLSRRLKDVGNVTLDTYLDQRKRRRPPRQINGAIEFEDVD